MSTLSDAFDGASAAVAPALWTVTASAGTASTGDGALALAPQASARAEAFVTSKTTYRLLGSAAAVRVLEVVNPQSYANNQLRLRLDWFNYLGWTHEQGVLYASHTVGGLTTTVAALPYTSGEHTWWRIREESGTVVWETAPDGVRWTAHASVSASRLFALTALLVELDARTWAGGGVLPGNARYTDLNPPAPAQCGAAPTDFGPGPWPSGCWRPLAATSPFNTPLPGNPRLVANWPKIVEHLTTYVATRYPDKLVSDASGSSGQPTYYGRPADPEYDLTCTMKIWGICPFYGGTLRVPEGARVEGDQFAAVTNCDDPDPKKHCYLYQPDAHLTIVDQQAGSEYDLWQVHRNVPPEQASRGIRQQDGRDLAFSWGGLTKVGGTGFDGSGSATAAHFASLAGRLRVEELEIGEIRHALTIVVKCNNSRPEPLPNDPTRRVADWVYPAQAGGLMCSQLKDPVPEKDAPPMGTRFQLAMSQAEIDALPSAQFPAWKKTILRAAAIYGLIVGDTGTDGYFALETESGNQYLALGYPDRWRSFARRNGWSIYQGSYIGNLTGVLPNGQDIWKQLQVVDPCVSSRQC